MASAHRDKWEVELVDPAGVKTVDEVSGSQLLSRLRDGKKVVIPFSRLGPEGIGPASLLGGFLGALAKDHNYIPITYESWKKVTDQEKNDLMEIVWRCIVIEPPEMKSLASSYILTDLNKKWRDFKTKLWTGHAVNTLKAKMKKDVEAAGEEFDRSEFVVPTRAWALEHKPSRIPPPMWAQFVDLRLRPDMVELARKNSAAKRNHKSPHTGGSKKLRVRGFEL
ncbi:hypothetical protein LINPERHAP1_LOCUS22988, partial [Linum perenne]